MNRNFFVVFDYLKFRMIDEQTRAFAFAATEHNQALPGSNHLLDIMQIEPAAGKRLAQRMRAIFVQHRFENFTPPETTPSRLYGLAPHTAGSDGFLPQT